MAAKLVVLCDRRDISRFVSETIEGMKNQRERSISQKNTIFCNDVPGATGVINWANSMEIYLFIVSNDPARIIKQIGQRCRSCLSKLSIVVLNFDQEMQYSFDSENCPIEVLVRKCSKNIFAEELQKIRKELKRKQTVRSGNIGSFT